MDTEYVIYETPHKPDTAPPDTGNPDMDDPHTAEPETGNPGELNTQIPNTKKSITQVSSTQSFSPPSPSRGEDGQTDGAAQLFEIRERIDYELLCQQYRQEQVDELVELMLEVQMNRGKTIRLGQNSEFPTSFVQARFSKIGRDHLEKVLDGINENTTAVKNTKAYLLSALFNAVSTIDNHYTMLVNHDFYGNDRSHYYDCGPDESL